MDQSDLDFLFFFLAVKKKLTLALDHTVTSSFPFSFYSVSLIKMTLRNRGWEETLFFCLKLVPQDGNLATDVETEQICLQSSRPLL